MGWLYCEPTKKDLISHIVKNFDAKAHCVRGNVLWLIAEYKDGTECIVCCLMASAGKYHPEECRWGYKDMTESSFPYRYSCPISYLDRVPETCPKWRARVRSEYARKNTRLKVGDIAQLTEGYNPAALRITSVRPLRGESATGYPYRIPRSALSGRVFSSFQEWADAK